MTKRKLIIALNGIKLVKWPEMDQTLSKDEMQTPAPPPMTIPLSGQSPLFVGHLGIAIAVGRGGLLQNVVQ